MAVGLRAAVPCRSTTAVRGEPVRFAQGKLPLHLPERPSLAFGVAVGGLWPACGLAGRGWRLLGGDRKIPFGRKPTGGLLPPLNLRGEVRFREQCTGGAQGCQRRPRLSKQQNLSPGWGI